MTKQNLEPRGHGLQRKKFNDPVEVLLYVVLRYFYNEFGVLGVSFIAAHVRSMLSKGHNFMPLLPPLSTSGEGEGGEEGGVRFPTPNPPRLRGGQRSVRTRIEFVEPMEFAGATETN